MWLSSYDGSQGRVLRAPCAEVERMSVSKCEDDSSVLLYIERETTIDEAIVETLEQRFEQGDSSSVMSRSEPSVRRQWQTVDSAHIRGYTAAEPREKETWCHLIYSCPATAHSCTLVVGGRHVALVDQRERRGPRSRKKPCSVWVWNVSENSCSTREVKTEAKGREQAGYARFGAV